MNTFKICLYVLGYKIVSCVSSFLNSRIACHQKKADYKIFHRNVSRNNSLDKYFQYILNTVMWGAKIYILSGQKQK